MDDALREQLRTHISVALAVAPKSVKRAFIDSTNPGQQAAQRALSQAVADYVLGAFEVSLKRAPTKLGQHSQILSSLEEAPGAEVKRPTDCPLPAKANS